MGHGRGTGVTRRHTLFLAPLAAAAAASGRAVAADPRLDQRWRCGASECPGYVYDPRVGEPSQDVAPGTPFHDVPESFFCPACGAAKIEFVRVGDRRPWRVGLTD